MKREKLTKSNFEILERCFSNIIIRVDKTDQTGMTSKPNVTRKMYTFKNQTFLSITERYTSDGFIDYYNYDLYDVNEKILMKFHSEPHKDKNYCTKTEPYHIHKINLLGVEERLPNYSYKRLSEILELIRFNIE